MSLAILEAISKLAPVLTGMSAAAGKNQDTNTALSNNAAAQRPGMVAQNLRNSRLASMFAGYTPPKFNWDGPGSVNRTGKMPTITGGTSPDSPDTSALEAFVQKDAVQQALNNYGIQNPAESSTGSKVLGAAATGSSILGALAPLLGLFGKGSSPSGSSTPITGGQFDADGNWVPAPAGMGMFPVLPENPNHE